MPGVYGTIRGSILYIYYLLPCKYHSCIKEYYRKSQYAVSCVPRKQSMPQGARAKIFLSSDWDWDWDWAWAWDWVL